MDSKEQQEEEKPKFYYSIIPDALLDDKNVPREAKHFWTEIYRYCQHKSSDHPSTMRSMDFFAEQVGVKRRTAQRWKANLINEGWAIEKRRFNKTSILILNKVKEKPLGEETDRGSYDTDVTSTPRDLDELIPR